MVVPKVAAWMQDRLGRPVDPRRGWDYLQRVGYNSPEAKVELWSQDEHRIGLKPILRRVWARKGSRVRAVVRPRYQWMYLYGFVEPQSGKTSWLLMPTVNTAAFSLALAAFVQEQGAGPHKQILLVLDQAGWH